MPYVNSLEGVSAEDLAAVWDQYNQLAKNPETREILLRLQKKNNPKAMFPEIDIKDQVASASAKLQEKIDSQATKLLQMEAEQRIRDERANLASQGFNAADIQAIETEMVESKKTGTVLTYESAAKYYKALKQTAVPTSSPHVTDLNNTMPETALQAFQKGGMRGLKKLTNERVAKAFDDINAVRIKLQ